MGPSHGGDDLHDPSLRLLAYDPGAARQRLRRAGYRGETIHFETTAGMIANDRLMAKAIAEMWEDVGVRVALDMIDIETRATGRTASRGSGASGGRIRLPPTRVRWLRPEGERLGIGSWVAAVVVD